MTSFATSADGTRIAYEVLGSGPPVLVVGGMFCHRPQTAHLAAALAHDFTVVHHDRRGRGESGDTPPYAVAREVEDITAVLDAAVGGPAALYGHSSGASLVMEAVVAGVPATHLVMHEPPYSDDPDDGAASMALARAVADAIAEDRRGDAIRLFLGPMGLPAEVLDGAASDPGMLAVSPTMPYDFAVQGDDVGAPFPVEKARAVPVPTLLLAGTESPEFFRATATRLAELVPDARLELLEGAAHDAGPDLTAPAVRRFLRG